MPILDPEFYPEERRKALFPWLYPPKQKPAEVKPPTVVAAAVQPSAGVTRAVVWKTVTLGLHSSGTEYGKAMKKAGFNVSDWASDILKKTPIATEPQELDLVLVTGAQLGFTTLTLYDHICRRAKERRYDLCPAEVALALRLASTDQPVGEWFVVAMEALTDSGGYLRVFSVGRRGVGSWLDTYSGNPDDQWNPKFSFVFVQRKSR